MGISFWDAQEISFWDSNGNLILISRNLTLRLEISFWDSNGNLILKCSNYEDHAEQA